MATPLPPGLGAGTPNVGTAGGLDAPPPSPALAGSSPTKALVAMGREIDRALTTMATAMPGGAGGAKIAQAKRLIQAALGEALASAGDAGISNPDEAGDQFAGGGIGSGLPIG